MRMRSYPNYDANDDFVEAKKYVKDKGRLSVDALITRFPQLCGFT